MELVDMRDLGSRASRRTGSSPFIRTSAKAVDFHRRLLLCLVLRGVENGSSHNSIRKQGKSGGNTRC